MGHMPIPKPQSVPGSVPPGTATTWPQPGAPSRATARASERVAAETMTRALLCPWPLPQDLPLCPERL